MTPSTMLSPTGPTAAPCTNDPTNQDRAEREQEVEHEHGRPDPVDARDHLRRVVIPVKPVHPTHDDADDDADASPTTTRMGAVAVTIVSTTTTPSITRKITKYRRTRVLRRV